MKSRILCSLLLLAAVVIAAPSVADKKTETMKPTSTKTAEQPKAMPDEHAMMEDMMKLAAPGDAHKFLATMVGNWDVEVKSWMNPAAPPTVTKGSTDSKMIMGGRYLAEEVKGEMMGMPFEGYSLLGYDNMKKKYVSTWVDNMGTGILLSEGTYDPAAKAMTMSTTTWDPMTKKDVRVRMVTRFVDDNKHVFEWYGPGMDGKEYKGMEITYTRKSS